jgi:hypothetical protein
MVLMKLTIIVESLEIGLSPAAAGPDERAIFILCGGED